MAVNGRFLGMPITGVQRYAYELVRRLPRALDADVLLVRPGAPTTELDAGGRLPVEALAVHGARGHLWEQAALPGRLHRTGRPLLFSPCNWGPLAVTDQVVMVHDAGPLLHPQLFERSYVRWARLVLRALAGRVSGIVTSCERTRQELCEHLPVEPARVWIVPPGVSRDFTEVPSRPAGDYCVFVGGRDQRKNLSFVRDFWPDVHHELGLTLRVVARSGTTTRREDELRETRGVVVVPDPTDAELADLYAGSLCLLWPSRYEGYGLPLLEAMAAGTPFLSTDTGAAAELAVQGDQLLPLEAGRWREQLATLACSDTRALRAACRSVASSRTWDASGVALAAALRSAAR